jgi:hypothetical protein
VKLKEVHVDAIQLQSLDDENFEAIKMFCGKEAMVAFADGTIFNRKSDAVLLVYYGGDVTCMEPGDWIVRLGSKIVVLPDDDMTAIATSE